MNVVAYALAARVQVHMSAQEALELEAVNPGFRDDLGDTGSFMGNFGLLVARVEEIHGVEAPGGAVSLPEVLAPELSSVSPVYIGIRHHVHHGEEAHQKRVQDSGGTPRVWRVLSSVVSVELGGVRERVGGIDVRDWQFIPDSSPEDTVGLNKFSRWLQMYEAAAGFTPSRQ